MMEVIERHGMFGGEMLTLTHVAPSLAGAPMSCRAFTPPGFGDADASVKWPCLIALGGLTASDVNFSTKVTTVQRAAAAAGLVVLFPDTSPRNGVDDAHPLLGEGASYYVDATEEKWVSWKMYSYVCSDLPELLATSFRADLGKIGIMGHSMGGHGALVAYVRGDFEFASCSAFAPVSNPTAIEGAPAWRALSTYLGGGDAADADDAPWRAAWRRYDACELIRAYDGPKKAVLVDQGADDPKLRFLASPNLVEAARDSNVDVHYRVQDGYDHELGCFVATFAEEHVRYHASILRPKADLFKAVLGFFGVSAQY